MDRRVARILRLVDQDPALGGLVTIGFRLDVPGARRIAPGAALSGYHTPWGRQPGLLDQGGCFSAQLDLLPADALAQLAQRLDAGDCTLVAGAAEAPPWVHLADRVAFWLTPEPLALPEPDRRPISLRQAVSLIAATASAWQVEGHRAEWFALRTAGAIAATNGRRRLQQGDVAEAIALVLAPRARAHPSEAAEPPVPQDQTPNRTDHRHAPPLPTPAPPLPNAPVQTRPSLLGAPALSVPGRRRRGALNLSATLLRALPWQALRSRVAGRPPVFRADDLQWHLHRHRAGRLILFVVDGSGSMGRRRLGQAKGAVFALLKEAYRGRDQVALILAAGEAARLLLAPARAVEQARRTLTGVPAGGATPLAGALLLALHLARQAGQKEGRQPLLLALTDGRANRPVGPGRPVRDELKSVALALRKGGVQALVLSEPGMEARELAAWLGAALRPVAGLNRPRLPAP